ncbi:hypothetical protein F5Y00DRAFT_19809 [Daldinia vernicosa]|uniref:uncharacterized protein n=1 Tax=Daldinia vernicosa TaxID=114800 RepID=UPI002008326D|nr:uncharacterized protein F5Y00DRAFT_19809 [Daldinia vernicosa]KAI0851333.1 hypothetical protein F5Y00DRAFT_19809 [Daldinia vernicosa]
MTDSSAMENDAPECPSDAVSFPLQDFPFELREMVWIMAAEQAADAFRHKYPDFNRFWFTRHKPPYISFAAHTMDNRGDPHPSVLRDLRDFFWPLFLTNKHSYAIVSRYISKFHERKMAPQLALNFVDIFPLGLFSLDNVIRFSKRSTPALRSQIASGPSVQYPPMLQAAYEGQLEEVTSVMNVSIPASTFARFECNRARLSMLLRFRNLKKLYIKVDGLHLGTWPFNYESNYDSRVCAFIELSEFRGGKFRMKYDDLGSFLRAYRDRCSRFGADPGRYEFGLQAMEAWRDVLAWEQKVSDSFLEALDVFINKGVECVVVYPCKTKDLFSS